MTDLITRIEAGSALHRNIADEVPQLKCGRVWCTKCGWSVRVNAATALRNGWPMCCGYTMTIDSPEERAALKAKETSDAE